MDHMPEWKAAFHSPAFPCDGQRPTTIAALFHGIPKWSGSATLSLIAFCLIMLLGSPAQGQSETDDKLAPQDKVEIYILGWGPGGAAEALVLNDVFTIGTEGFLDLPIVGRVLAAGLRTNELTKLITYRLQERSGFAIRPLIVRALTTVQRRQSAASSDSAKIEEPPPSAVKLSADGSRTPVEPAATAQQQALERERSKVGALQRNLSAAHVEVEAARGEAVAARQGLAGQRQRIASLSQELSAARAAIATLKAEMARQTNAASRARETAEAKEHELVARERGEAAALEQSLCGRREIDALKNSRSKQPVTSVRKLSAASWRRRARNLMRCTAQHETPARRRVQLPTGRLSKTEPW